MKTLLRQYLAILSLLASSSALAQGFTDNFTGTVRDASLWNERESGTASNELTTISQNDVVIVDGTRGQGGGGAYLSTKKVDWNDPFTLRFSMAAGAFTAVGNKPKATIGLGIGLGTDAQFSLSAGFPTGFHVEIANSNLTGRTLQLVRKRGKLRLVSAAIPIDDQWHDYELRWMADPTTRTITAELYLDGVSAAPNLTLSGIEQTFAGATTPGATIAFFGIAKGRPLYSGQFDNLVLEGDLTDAADTNDAGWSDDDTPPIPLDFAETAIAYAWLTPQETGTVISLQVSNTETTIICRSPSANTKAEVVRVSRGFAPTVTRTTRTATDTEKALFNLLMPPRVHIASFIYPFVEMLNHPNSKLFGLNFGPTSSAPNWTVVLDTGASEPVTRVLPGNGMTTGDGQGTVSTSRLLHCFNVAGAVNPAFNDQNLACRITSGNFETVDLIPTSTTQVRVRKYNALTGEPIGTGTTRNATAEELQIIAVRSEWGPDGEDPTWCWARIAEDLGDVPVVSVAFTPNEFGSPAWTYVYLNGAGQLVEVLKYVE